MRFSLLAGQFWGGYATSRPGRRPRAETWRLRAGDWVEVRSPGEILATLDDRGCRDNLPFMPEMLHYCGRRLRVLKSAHKTCDTIRSYRIRAMPNAVHLDQSRCDGAAHGGCQARCLLFWNTAWLKPAGEPGPAAAAEDTAARIEALGRATRVDSGDGEAVWRCQATALLDATTPLDWRDPRPYWRDLTSGNIGLFGFLRHVARAAWMVVARRLRRDPDYPNRPGRGPEPDPAEKLDLKPGERARVRSRAEIYRTLTAGRKNKGLWFDVEMEALCGRTCTVLARVDHIVDEKTGRMIHMSRDCIILEEGGCSGCLSRNRLFCPRQIYAYWREAWLERAP